MQQDVSTGVDFTFPIALSKVMPYWKNKQDPRSQFPGLCLYNEGITLDQMSCINMSTISLQVPC